MERIENIYYREIQNRTLTFEEVDEVQAFVNKTNPISLYNIADKRAIPLAVKKVINLVTEEHSYAMFLSSPNSTKMADMEMVALRIIHNERFIAEAEREAKFYLNHLQKIILTRNFSKG